MKDQKLSIAHISDPHFGTSTPEKILALTNVLQELSPGYVVLSGDITQRARKDQFLAARRFCDSLSPLDVIAVPGNHDIPLFNLPARLISPYGGFTKHFGFPLTFSRKKDFVELMGINSTHPLRHVQGQFGDKGRQALRSFSDDSLVRIVVAHHPLDCPKHVDEKNILKDAPETLKALEDAKVDIIMGGHIHDPLVRLSAIRYPQSARPFVVVQAGTCLSSRTRAKAPNSFNLLEIKIEFDVVYLKVVRYDLTADLTYFPVSQTCFRRPTKDQWLLSNEDRVDLQT
jgi:predicted MPP superfamily phosphohydrolase